MNYNEIKEQLAEFTCSDEQYDYWSRIFNSQQSLKPDTIYMSRELFDDLKDWSFVYVPADPEATYALERGC